jgi:hypothetical protein
LTIEHGFGLGWYGDHPEPGLYRETRPAWSDENLRYLCRHLHSHLFFAHYNANTLYFREDGERLIVVSEPFDKEPDWTEVPSNHVLVALASSGFVESPSIYRTRISSLASAGKPVAAYGKGDKGAELAIMMKHWMFDVVSVYG